MNAMLTETLKGIALGDVQTYRNLAVFPVLADHAAGPAYITLAAALRAGTLKVEEVSEGGSVPELKVTNSGGSPVLLIDGEELAGAKQNRVLNTTVLLKPQSTTIINVSCTERGRWSYETREFRDSDVVMARNIRARKSQSVSACLEQSQRFFSNQGEIWEEIDSLCASSGVQSATGAMRDVYEGKKDDLQTSLNAFPLVAKQRGLVFVMDRAVLGMDLVSRPEAYADLHAKLLRSYVVDARPRHVDGQPAPTRETVDQFIGRLLECSERSFPSVGIGTDVRMQGSGVCGSALLHEKTCIHAAFFSTVPFEDISEMRGYRHRRDFRL